MVINKKNINKEIGSKKQKRYLNIIIILIILIIFMIVTIFSLIGKIGENRNSAQIIYVTNDSIEFPTLRELKIFRNSKFQNKNIISPGSYGSYTFLVQNVTDKSIVYDLSAREINNDNINMKYKLKIENVYISDTTNNFKSVDEIDVKNIVCAPYSTNVFTLIWMWDHDDRNDTFVGSLPYSNYVLRIQINAQYFDRELGKNE